MNEISDIINDLRIEDKRNHDPQNNPWVNAWFLVGFEEPCVLFTRHPTKDEAVEKAMGHSDIDGEENVWGYIYFNNKTVYDQYD